MNECEPLVQGREEMYASSAMSIGMGSVHLQLQVLTRGMEAGSGVHIGGPTEMGAAGRQRERRQRGAARDELSPTRAGRRLEQSDSGDVGWDDKGSGLASVRRNINDPHGSGLGASSGAAGLGANSGARMARGSGAGAAPGAGARHARHGSPAPSPMGGGVPRAPAPGSQPAPRAPLPRSSRRDTSPGGAGPSQPQPSSLLSERRAGHAALPPPAAPQGRGAYVASPAAYGAAAAAEAPAPAASRQGISILPLSAQLKHL